MPAPKSPSDPQQGAGTPSAGGARSTPRLEPAVEARATLANVWPPRLPEDLRRVVQSDVGEHGFSHVQAVEEGAVLLLSADALVLWRAPEDFTAVPYSCVKVRRRRIGKPEVTLQLEPDPSSSATEDAEPEPSSPSCVTYDLEKDLAERVELLVARHESSARTASVRAASVRAAVVEIAPTPTRADPPHPAQAGRARPSHVQDAVPAAREVRPQAQPVPDVIWDGVVVSALDPIGYVLRPDRGALVAVLAAHPVGVEARVRAATRMINGREHSIVVDDDVDQEFAPAEDRA